MNKFSITHYTCDNKFNKISINKNVGMNYESIIFFSFKNNK